MAATSGLSAATAVLVLNHINTGSATGIAFATAHRCQFLSAIRTTSDGTDTQWTGGSYVSTAGATNGQPITFAGAATSPTLGATTSSNVVVTQTGSPQLQWAGNKVMDTSATPKELWYAPLTGGPKAINAGDTCTIQSGQFTVNLG
jgi:hypothetical protein